MCSSTFLEPEGQLNLGEASTLPVCSVIRVHSLQGCRGREVFPTEAGSPFEVQAAGPLGPVS